jgi:uncharacterized membrane protein YbaN (DUF454 family)
VPRRRAGRGAPGTPSRVTRSSRPAPTATEGLGDPVSVPRDGWRARVRSRPGLREAYRVVVFAAGLLFIALGIALAALPGPLTIPPVLLGLWIWSTEFRFAERLFERFRAKGRDAWDHAKRHPVTSSAVTVGGLAAAAAAFWAVSHFALLDRARDAIL